MARRLVVLSYEEIEKIINGDEVTFEAFDKNFVLINEKGLEKIKKVSANKLREVK